MEATGEWLRTEEARKALGVTAYRFNRLINEAGVKRYKLASRDMRTWYIRAEDLPRLKDTLAAPRVASMKPKGKRARAG